MSNFSRKIVGWKVYKLSVEHCIVEGTVSEDLFDVQNVFGSMILHCCFPMSEGVKMDLKQSRIL